MKKLVAIIKVLKIGWDGSVESEPVCHPVRITPRTGQETGVKP